VSLQTGLPELQADDWSKLFVLLNEKLKKGRVILLLDEISWMGSKDPDFLGKLKNAWDIYWKKHSKLIVVLCGSASTWIEKNILSSAGFHGRISQRHTLEELPIDVCKKFWETANDGISAYEKFKVMAVTGGVPRYLEEINPRKEAEENIKELFFVKDAAFLDEFEEIFNDLFSTRNKIYKKIVKTLSKGSLTIEKICEKVSFSRSGLMSEYLEDLATSGFLTRDYTWNVDSGIDSTLSQYRLSDNYVRFYLKYIDNKLTKIKRNSYDFRSLASIPGWETMMGLQFENLVLKNRDKIKEMLGIRADEIVSDNPFFQKRTVRHPGCQVDYMIQTKYKTLYVIEIKFMNSPIKGSVISEVKEKIRRLVRPKGFSVRPVLIHVNGVLSNVEDADYFSAIINFSNYLEDVGCAI